MVGSSFGINFVFYYILQKLARYVLHTEFMIP